MPFGPTPLTQTAAVAGTSTTPGTIAPNVLAAAIAALGGGGTSGAATTAAILYVDTLGSDATGGRGNPSKPFLTGTAAYAAASDGDVISFGVGTFTLNASGTQKAITYRGADRATTFLTINFTGSDLGNGGRFANIYAAMNVDGALTDDSIDLIAYFFLQESRLKVTITNCFINFDQTKVYCDGPNSIPSIVSDGVGTAESVIGSITFYGGDQDADPTAGITNAASNFEVYLIGSTKAEVSISSNGGSTKTGEVNASGCYGVTATADTIRIQNSAYSSLTYNTLVDGGGNRDGIGDIVQGYVATSPNGTRYRITVNNDGSLTTTAL